MVEKKKTFKKTAAEKLKLREREVESTPEIVDRLNTEINPIPRRKSKSGTPFLLKKPASSLKMKEKGSRTLASGTECLSSGRGNCQ